MDADQMLLTLLAEIEVFAEVSDELLDAGTPHLRAFAGRGVPYRPAAWVAAASAALPPARRMACSRTARRLALRGLVRRITDAGRDRVRFLRPTAAGLARALRLAGAEAEGGAVAEALRRTRWGRRLAAVPATRPVPPGPPTLAHVATGR